MYICLMAEDKEKKGVQLNIRITEATKRGLDKLAAADRRTVSDYIRIQLENLVANGLKK
jgi:uncharacterized protein (DUF1778 family)